VDISASTQEWLERRAAAGSGQPPIPMVKLTPRSQKARGVIALAEHGLKVPPFRLVQESDQIEGALAALKRGDKPLIARPCPVRPRHGFVDSRIVSGLDDIMGVFAETKNADPDGEMLLMHAIPAAYSFIATPGSLAIGPNSDGATSGYGSFQLFVPKMPIVYKTGVESAAGITETPYVEGVIDGSGRSYIVQMRDGPEVSKMLDFVVEPFRVKHVVAAEGDLIEWESRARAFPEGTVVWHPGGNTTSHYFIHARLNKVPVMITRKPEVGELLEPTTEGGSLDAECMLDGFLTGTRCSLDYASALHVALFALHNVGANFTPAGSRVLGLGAALCVRLSEAACLGEYRFKAKAHSAFFQGQRTQVFERAWPDLLAHRRKWIASLRSFTLEQWNGGYGGKKWGHSAHAGLQLLEAAMQLCKWPTEASATQLVAELNNAINQYHNGGWLFNKFASQSIMDQAAQSDPHFLQAAIPAVAKAFYQCNETDERPRWTKLRRSSTVRKLGVVLNQPIKLGELEMIQVRSLSKDGDAIGIRIQARATDGRNMENSYKLAGKPEALKALIADEENPKTWLKLKSQANTDKMYLQAGFSAELGVVTYAGLPLVALKEILQHFPAVGE
jgi:hypothetical protein